MGGFNKRCAFAFATLLCLTGWSGFAYSQSLKDLLKGAIEDYIEQKADQAGIDQQPEESTADEVDSNLSSAQNVVLSFANTIPQDPDVFEALYTSSPPNNLGGTGNTPAERQCFALIQGKVAWNYAGNKQWTNSSINNLCKGTTQASQPPNCFSRAMFKGHEWGKKSEHQMTWSLASSLCAGTNNSNKKIACLKKGISQNKSLNAAISSCGGTLTLAVKPIPIYQRAQIITPVPVLAVSAESQCIQYVQGNIAWDAAGKKKTWSSTNVSKLCKGTTSKTAPGTCVNYVLHKRSQWTKSVSLKADWRAAIDLCEGVNNAATVTQCFKKAIAKTNSVTKAIRRCES